MEPQELVEKYKKGTLTSDELSNMEEHIEKGELDITQFKDIHELSSALDRVKKPAPSHEMTEGFYAMLGEHKMAQRKVPGALNISHWFVSKPVLRWAYSLALVVVGLGAGWFLHGSQGQNDDLRSLSAEVTEMKEMMLLTLLEKESISERLRAVSLTNEMPDVSSKVVDALLQTLNSDDNVNVRLASLEALYVYSGNARVREGLIMSISEQESPMVQMALAEMMVVLQEKKSAGAFRELLDKDETAIEVKDRIEESLKVLI